jgi:regulator of replication initiation timing
MSSRDHANKETPTVSQQTSSFMTEGSPLASPVGNVDAFRWSVMPSNDIAPGFYNSSDDEDDDDDDDDDSFTRSEKETPAPVNNSALTSLDRAISSRSGLGSFPPPAEMLGGGLNTISENSPARSRKESDTSDNSSAGADRSRKTKSSKKRSGSKEDDTQKTEKEQTLKKNKSSSGKSTEGKSLEKQSSHKKKTDKNQSLDKGSSHSHKKRRPKKIRSKSPLRIDFAGQVISNSDLKSSSHSKRGKSPKRAHSAGQVKAEEAEDEAIIASTASGMKEKKKNKKREVVDKRLATVQKSLGKQIDKSEIGKSDRISFSTQLRVSFLSDRTSSSFGYEEASTELKNPSLDEERQRVSAMLDELEDYEKTLSREHAVLELERESLEFEFDKQMTQNQQLEQTVHEMQDRIEELEKALQNQEEEETLRLENEILRQRLERQEAALMNMNMSSYSKESVDNIDDMSSVHDNSIAGEKPSAKHQGNLLQANAKLAEKDAHISKQAQEIQALQQDIEDYQDENGTRKMKVYIEGLEKEKTYFISEIARLKKPRSSFGFGRTSKSNHSNAMSSLGVLSAFSGDDSSSFLSLGEVGNQPFGEAGRPNHRSSTTTWRSRIFGAPKPAVQKTTADADKMLDDLTRDL